MLHEFGHALYDPQVDRDLPWLLRTHAPAHDRGHRDALRPPGPRRRVARRPSPACASADLERARAAPRASRAAPSLLTFARWVLVMTHFERGLYADPDARPRRAAGGTSSSASSCSHRPEGRDAPDWAAKLHLALAPVYYQNYLYGELVASQLQATLRERAGGIVDRPAAGALLVDEFFAPGLSVRWDALVEQRDRRAAHRAPPRRRARSPRSRRVRHAVHRRPDTGTLFAQELGPAAAARSRSSRASTRRAGGGTLRTQYLDAPRRRRRTRSLLSRPAWLWGAEHGVNEHGVAIGNEKVWTDRRRQGRAAGAARHGPRPARARTRPHRRRGARRSSPTLLEAHGQGGSGEQDHDEPYFSSFLIADPAGGWIVETSGRTGPRSRSATAPRSRTGSRSAPTGPRASADVAPGRDFQDWRDPKAPTAIADLRLDATDARASPADRRDAATRPARARRDAATPRRPVVGRARGLPIDASSPVPTGVDADWNGVTVCMHLRDYQATTASMVAELPADPDAPLRAWVALGSPCASVYVPVFPPLGVPTELAPARDLAAVRRAAGPGRGRPRRARRGPSARLAGVEAELWERGRRRGRTGATAARSTSTPRPPGPRSTPRSQRSASDAPAADGVRQVDHPSGPSLGSDAMEYNLADLWERVVDTVPDREALVAGDLRLTYARGRRSHRPARPLPRRSSASGRATTSRCTCTTASSTSRACSPRSRSARSR